MGTIGAVDALACAGAVRTGTSGCDKSLSLRSVCDNRRAGWEARLEANEAEVTHAKLRHRSFSLGATVRVQAREGKYNGGECGYRLRHWRTRARLWGLYGCTGRRQFGRNHGG